MLTVTWNRGLIFTKESILTLVTLGVSFFWSIAMALYQSSLTFQAAFSSKSCFPRSTLSPWPFIVSKFLAQTVGSSSKLDYNSWEVIKLVDGLAGFLNTLLRKVPGLLGWYRLTEPSGDFYSFLGHIGSLGRQAAGRTEAQVGGRSALGLAGKLLGQEFSASPFESVLDLVA